MTAPADLTNGDAIVRVVVTDGVRSGQGDSGVFDIGVPEQLLPERVVSGPGRPHRSHRARGHHADATGAGNLDDEPGRHRHAAGRGDGAAVNGQAGWCRCHPDWRGDGTAIAFDGEVDGRRDLFVVDRDGANLRRVTGASTSPGQQFVCADCIPTAGSSSRTEPPGSTRTTSRTSSWLSSTRSPALSRHSGWGSNNYYNQRTAIGCARWSPDGGEVLMANESSSIGTTETMCT